jgi:DNA-directed RNA polymerase specialized sigma24 family protein
MNNPLDSITETLDYTVEAVALAEQVRLGSRKARVQMIEGHVRLVFHKVDSWLAVFPTLKYLREDMVSEGLLALVRAVDNIAISSTPSEKDNPTGYISVAIHNALSDYAMDEATIRVPRSVEVNKRASVTPRVHTGLGIESTSIMSLDHERLVEVKDMLTVICRTEYDAPIMELRTQGYTDAEIGNQLGIPGPTVYMLRKELYERFQLLENKR